MASSSQFGLGEPLHDPPSNETTVDIVFVHGLQGHREKTWTTKGTDDEDPVFWPRELLKEVCKDARILSFGYDASVVHFINSGNDNQRDPPKTTIDDHSAALIDALKGLRASTNTTDRPIMFVAHSLGGLVCANAIAMRYTEDGAERAVQDKVRGVIFLGTPFAGSKQTPFALIATQFLRLFVSTSQTRLEVLDKRSERLVRVSDEFLKVLWARHSSDAPIQVAFYYEEYATKRHKVNLGFIVDKSSAVPLGFPGVPIPGNHSDMCKFPDPSHNGFISISTTLHQWIQDLDPTSEKHSRDQGGVNVGSVKMTQISNVNGVLAGVIAGTRENANNVIGQRIMKITVLGNSPNDLVEKLIQHEQDNEFQ